MFSRGPVQLLAPDALTLRPLNLMPVIVLRSERPPLDVLSNTISFVETAQAGRPVTMFVNSTVTKPVEVTVMDWMVVAFTLPAAAGAVTDEMKRAAANEV